MTSCGVTGQASSSTSANQNTSNTSNTTNADSTSNGENVNSTSNNASTPTSSNDGIEDIVDSGTDINLDNLSIQNSPILHAWGWKVDDVKSNLKNISDAGFRAVQLSPLHPSKSTDANHSWWNLYQPLGFKVATGNENPLGDKTKLTALTKEAEKYDIKIVMDVVTNHLAGSASGFDGAVRNYEATIVDNDLMWHYGEVPQSAYTTGDREKITNWAIGLPDLKTKDSRVQNRVISMLKEYIDCGVKGFRFDAAKHIETPDDGASFKSDYWPNVTKAIEDYGMQKYNEKPFVYGEILENPGNISWEAYTKYMSVTESDQGDKIRNAVNEGNAANAAYSSYKNGHANKAILWAESHDTFANQNGSTRKMDTKVIDLAYAIQISRKEATALYFDRPANANPNSWDDKQVMTPGDGYKAKLVTASNKFHLDFLGGSETISNYDYFMINIRKTKNNEGALIAKIGSTSTNEVNLNGLSDGTYTDLMTNKTFEIRNGKATLSFTDNCVILEKDPNASKESVSGLPTVSVTSNKTSFGDKATITVTAQNATLSYYQINNGSKVLFTNTASFEVGSDITEGDITIKVSAKNDIGGKVSSLTVTKYVDIGKDIALLNVPNDVNVLAWIWKSGQEGKWVNMETVGTARGFNLTGNEDSLIFVTFATGVTAQTADWSKKIKQTDDLRIDAKIYKYNDLMWS